MQGALCTDTMNLKENILVKNTGPQLEIFDNRSSQYGKFLRFHVEYPQVYRYFEMFAMQLINAGHKTLGSKMIIERIRWEVALKSVDVDGFKINNNFTCYYSRLFMKNNPKYDGYFETRIIKRA